MAAFVDEGPVSLVLNRVDSPETDASLTEIVFRSEHVRDTYQALEERGVPFEAELRVVTSNQGQDHIFAAHFRDPDGHYGTLTGWADSE